MPNYVDRSDLQELVRDAQARGKMTSSLESVIRSVADGVQRRWYFVARPRMEEYRATLVAKVEANLHKADPALNLFGWLTTIALRLARQVKWRKPRKRKKG